MSIKHLDFGHYSMNNPASVYDEEAVTALELVGRSNAKVNEIVDSQNSLVETTNTRLNAQDTKIENRLKQQETVQIPTTVSNEVNKHITSGDFDKQINSYAGGLSTRVDDLLGRVTEGTTTMDAEIIDGRITIYNDTNHTIGKSLRTQINKYGIGAYAGPDAYFSFDTTNKMLSLVGNYFYIFHNKVRYDIAPFTISYEPAIGNSGARYLVYDVVAQSPMVVTYNNLTDNQIIIFYFSANQPHTASTNTIPGRYYVDGRQIGDNVIYKRGEVLASNANFLNFNTQSKTLSFSSECYLCYGNARYNVLLDGEISYNVGTNVTKLLTYNPSSNTVAVVDITQYQGDTIIICEFNSTLLDRPTNVGLIQPYTVDGVVYSRYGSTISDGNEKVGYVSALSGSDSNEGGKNSPFKTIQKAINEGCNTINIASGVYKQGITISNANNVRLIGESNGQVVIDCGVDLTLTKDSATNLLKCDYVSSQEDMMYKTFVDKSVDIVDGSSARSVGYRVNLWKKGVKLTEDFKLKPVLSLTECMNTVNSWYHNGQEIYVNSTEGEFKLSDSKISRGITLSNISNVVIENIKIEYAYQDCCYINKCGNVVIRNCEFNYSGLGEGLALTDVTGDITRCIAHHNRNDGFNIHDDGNTTFTDCEAFNNYDDGISHHDACTGTVIGGKYYNNGKGGVSSPTHGASVNIYNVLSYNNRYGILASTDDINNIPEDIIINNCCLHHNQVGIKTNYKILSINNTLKNNILDKEITDNGLITEL